MTGETSAEHLVPPHTHTHIFASASGKLENHSKRTVGPRDDKHATE